MSPPSLSPEMMHVLSGYGTGLVAATEFVPSARMADGMATRAARASPQITGRQMRLNNFIMLLSFYLFKLGTRLWALLTLTPARLKPLNYFWNFQRDRLKDSLRTK